LLIKRILTLSIILLFIGVGIVSALNVNISDESKMTIMTKKLVSSQFSRNLIYYPYFDVGNSNIIDGVKDDIIDFNAESNESILIVKVTNPHQILLEKFSYNITQASIGKKYSSGAFLASGQVYDEGGAEYLEPLMLYADFGFDTDIKLRYLHYKLGLRIKNTWDNRILKEYDNESIFSVSFDYPFVPSVISPGTRYYVFSSVIYDLKQTDITTKQSVEMIFSGNLSGVNITTSEGGNIFGFWYGEYNATVIASKSNMYEFMLNGKKNLHVENTLFYWYNIYPYYWYAEFPIYRGFWNIKWITPNETKTFHLLVIDGHLHYFNDIEGIFYGMGISGDYQIRTGYLDYHKTFSGPFGAVPAFYPIFAGLDITLP